ncbi:MAG: BPL-N domain-containing protein [Thermoproteota archaeon]
MKWWRVPFKAVEGEPCSNTFRLVNSLSEAGFNVGRLVGLRSLKGTGLQPGDFVVGVEDHYSERLVNNLGEEYGVDLKPLKTFDPESVVTVRSPLIGVYSGEGAGPSYTQDIVEALEEMGFRKVSLLTGPLTPGDLSSLDALVFGGGDSFRILSSMKPDEARLIRQFVESGGVYIGVCGGAMLPVKPVNILGAAYGLLETWEELQVVECEILSDSVSDPPWPVFSGRRLGEVLRTYPVNGLVKSKIVKKGLLTLGYRGEVTMLHAGPLIKATDPEQVFGVIGSVLESAEYGLPCEKAVEKAQGASSIIMVEHGSGKIVLFTSHVESSETPAAHGLLGNALFLKTYGNSERRFAQHVEEIKPEDFMGASESCRVLKLIKDAANKLVEQVENVIPGLYASQLVQEASQISMFNQVINRIVARESIIRESMEEALKAMTVLQELRRKGFANPQVGILSSSLAEWSYVVSKARKALPPLLEKIVETQELMADLSTIIVSSDRSDVERRFAAIWNALAGGRARLEKGLPASPGVVSPLASLLINFNDSLEKMRLLRKILTYFKQS